jgi:hypothetical protein
VGASLLSLSVRSGDGQGGVVDTAAGVVCADRQCDAGLALPHSCLVLARLKFRSAVSSSLSVVLGQCAVDVWLAAAVCV